MTEGVTWSSCSSSRPILFVGTCAIRECDKVARIVPKPGIVAMEMVGVACGGYSRVQFVNQKEPENFLLLVGNMLREPIKRQDFLVLIHKFLASLNRQALAMMMTGTLVDVVRDARCPRGRACAQLVRRAFKREFGRL